MGQEGIEEANLTSSPLAVRGYEIVKVQGVSLYEGLHRIKALTQPDEFLEAVLESLAEHRNRLVHSGVFPKGAENLVFILKGLVDFTIRRIIYLSKHLSTESELGEFLKHSTLGDSTLERRRKVIGFIQSQRSKG